MKYDSFVAIDDFSLKLGTFQLNQINLSICEKEIFAILGKTGSGKTVLLESIAGFYQNGTGTIRINGQCISNVPIEKRGIGFVYQDFGLFPHMTVYDNIKYGLKAQKVDKNNCHRKINQIAETLSIGHILHQYPGTLSGGERQRTALARALVLNPKILLMDEPFSSLDPSTKNLMYQLIQEIHKRFGCTIIFVTHDFHEAQKMANRIGIMTHGCLKSIRDKDSLFVPCEDDEINEFLGISDSSSTRIKCSNLIHIEKRFI